MTYRGRAQETRTRTVTRDRWDAAQVAWAAGDFSAEWKPWRHLAAMKAGIVDPPTGSKWDDWTDAEPSQRAMLIRAIRETPGALRRAIETAPRPTWEAVLEGVLRHRDRMGEDADRREHEWDATRRAPMVPLADTLGVVANSLRVRS